MLKLFLVWYVDRGAILALVQTQALPPWQAEWHDMARHALNTCRLYTLAATVRQMASDTF